MAAAPHAGRVLRFSKMHGAGNDFVVIDLRDGTTTLDPALCRVLGDRHTGVGCDQILTIEAPRSASAVASYRIWNSDGSLARQCGNGARCVAAWLLRDGTAQGDRFDVDSPVDTHHVERLADDPLGNNVFRIAMGVPRFAPADVPLHGFDAMRDEYVLEYNDAVYSFGAVSMGNPHAVIEVDDVAAAPVEPVAQLLQSLPAFPDSVNVGFARVEARDRVRLRVYERGAGETLACGSGACAAAVVLMRRGRVDRELTIALPGGELQIAWPRDDAPVTMAGPAAFVFEGTFLIGAGLA
ncbi:diaminopimelate epimerase [Lysobacter yangpyeongensis]|uniref:Diaminopimelate epimerase n=1 Tax=Lysobacter yangpyeongensis TaxID=346182 RepID=A0ABW0SMA2_9GAMM